MIEINESNRKKKLSRLKLVIKEILEALNVIIPIRLWVKIGMLKKRSVKLSDLHTHYVSELCEEGFTEIDLLDFGVTHDLLCEFEKALDAQGVRRGSNKAYQNYFLGGDTDDSLALSDPAVAQTARMIFLNDSLLDLISVVFNNTEPDLRYLEVAESRTDKALRSERIYSQNWHRDNGGSKVIKLFICMSDVKPTDGPMEYVKQTHRSGSKTSALPTRGFGARTTPLISEGLVSLLKEQIDFVKGPKWSAFLCDTTGVHRGGNYNASSYRKMATAAYFYGNSSAPIKSRLQ
jgi:hypothetical protein